MIYATATQLLQWFDAQEIAQLATPRRYSVVDAELLELTASSGDRSAYNDLEIEAADATLVVINEALTAGTMIINSYVGQRYDLPLAQSQIDASPIPRHCGNIARYELTDDKEVEAITGRYKGALQWLRDIAIGKASLGTGEPAPAGGGAVVVSGPGRTFGRDRTGGVF